jgi:hypothetical protein
MQTKVSLLEPGETLPCPRKACPQPPGSACTLQQHNCARCFFSIRVPSPPEPCALVQALLRDPRAEAPNDFDRSTHRPGVYDLGVRGSLLPLRRFGARPRRRRHAGRAAGSLKLSRRCSPSLREARRARCRPDHDGTGLAPDRPRTVPEERIRIRRVGGIDLTRNRESRRRPSGGHFSTETPTRSPQALPGSRQAARALAARAAEPKGP